MRSATPRRRLGIGHLVAAVPALRELDLECEQIAQLDSKDMDVATWQALAARAAYHLARADVAGVVVTHGTDTLEETAYLLHRVLAPFKPLVLTAAMRPATSIAADGPQNLSDAVSTARDANARGVLVAFAGRVWSGAEVRKVHSYRVDAFAAGDAGPLALIEEGRLRWLREAPRAQALGLAHIARDAAQWPRVEIVTSHAGASGPVVDALVGARRARHRRCRHRQRHAAPRARSRAAARAGRRRASAAQHALRRGAGDRQRVAAVGRHAVAAAGAGGVAAATAG